jgi:hypothetical protein
MTSRIVTMGQRALMRFYALTILGGADGIRRAARGPLSVLRPTLPLLTSPTSNLPSPSCSAAPVRDRNCEQAAQRASEPQAQTASRRCSATTWATPDLPRKRGLPTAGGNAAPQMGHYTPRLCRARCSQFAVPRALTTTHQHAGVTDTRHSKLADGRRRRHSRRLRSTARCPNSRNTPR